MRRKLTAWLLAAAMVFSLIPAALAAGSAQPRLEITPYDGEVPQSVLDQLKGDTVQQLDTEEYDAEEVVRVIVELKGQTLLDTNVSAGALTTDQKAISMRQNMLSQQAKVEDKIKSLLDNGQTMTVSYNYTTVLNGLALEVPYGALEEIRQLPEVASVSIEHPFSLPVDPEPDNAQPNTASAGEMTGVPDTWLDGYTGKGMVVAVIDTGLDLTHPSFQAAPESPRLTQNDIDQVLNKLNAKERYPELTSENAYRSEKIPYAFNYVDGNLNAGHNGDQMGDHGTHVSGIVAANKMETTSVVGAAPDAQLVVMKVFGQRGGAYPADVVAAIEDAVLLNVDVINMSLGSPSGFSEEDSPYVTAIDRAVKAGVVVCASAGNEYSSAYANSTGVNLPRTENPDSGIVGSPSSISGAYSIASVNNKAVHSNGFQVGDRNIAFNDSGPEFGIQKFVGLADANDGQYEYVIVPGVGAAEDYEGLDVEGKIAVVLRGDLSFSEKHNNAAKAGATATIIRNNQPQMLSMDLSGVDGSVKTPCILIAQGAGQYMVDQAGASGKGTLTVLSDLVVVPAEDGYVPSDFSAWGVLPDLTLKPNVAGVGGNIYSTLNNGTYGNNSGTSMSSPQVAGMSALLLQHVREAFPDLTKAEVRAMTENLMMNTAKPVTQDDGVKYSPRKQGAGLVNVAGAVETPAYLTVQGNDQPKAELGDDPDRTGSYSFDFTVTNTGNEALQYLTSSSLLTETAQDGLILQWAKSLEAKTTFTVDGKALPYQYDLDGNGRVDTSDVRYLLAAVKADKAAAYENFCDFDATGSVDEADVDLFLQAVNGRSFTEFDVFAVFVDVPANGTTTVKVSINLTRDDKAYLEDNFVNGCYVEGFVSLHGVGTVDLSMPILAFYGDWTEAPLFDDVYAADVDASSNDGSVIGNNPGYPFMILTSQNTYLGMNPFAKDETYIPERSNALNLSGGDGGSIQNIYFDMLRSARNLRISFVDAKGKTLYESSSEYVAKSSYNQNYGEMLPVVYSWKDNTFGFDPAEYGLGAGDTFTIVMTGEKDYEGQYKTETLEFPVYIDTEAPVLDTENSSVDLDPETGKREITINVQDDHYVAGIVLFALDGQTAVASVDVNQTEEGAMNELTFDVADLVPKTGGEFLLAVGDYAQNMKMYVVNVLYDGETSVLMDHTFYGFYNYGTSNEQSGWYSFTEDDVAGIDRAFTTNIGNINAAAMVGDYIFATGVTDTDALFAINTATFEPRFVASLEFPSAYDNVIDMSYDYTRNCLYLLADVGYESILLRVDPQTEEVENLGAIDLSAIANPSSGYALACDKDGVLYAIVGERESDEWDAAESAILCKLDLSGQTPTAVKQMDLELTLGLNNVLSADFDLDDNAMYFTNYFAVYNWQDGTQESGAALYKATELEGTPELAKVGDFPEAAPCEALFLTNDRKVDFNADGAAKKMTISHHNLYLKTGDQAQLTVLESRPWFVDFTNYSIQFSSSDNAVATVDGNGYVKALAEGSTTISVTATRQGYPTLTETCEVAVLPAPSLTGLLIGAQDSKWVNLLAHDPWTMETAGTQMTTIGTAAAYAAGAGSDGQDLIYVLDNGKTNEGFITLYTYDAETMEPTGDPTVLEPTYYVPANMIPTDGFTDATYDPTTGYIFAVKHHRIFVIDPKAGNYHGTYEVRFIMGESDILAISFDSDGTGWLFNADGMLCNITWFLSSSLEFFPVAMFTDFHYNGGTSSMEYDDLNNTLWWANGNDLCKIDIGNQNYEPTVVATLGDDSTQGMVGLFTQQFPSGKNFVFENVVMPTAEAQAQVCEPAAAE